MYEGQLNFVKIYQGLTDYTTVYAGDINFTGDYSVDYIKAYNSYEKEYTKVWQGVYAGAELGYAKDYTGTVPYEGTYTKVYQTETNFTGEATFDSSYLGTTKPYTKAYEGNASYTKAYTKAYEGNIEYGKAYTKAYEGNISYEKTYTTLYSTDYDKIYEGLNDSDVATNYTKTYTKDYSKDWVKAYVGPTTSTNINT